MDAYETSAIRELTAQELEIVVGGFSAGHSGLGAALDWWEHNFAGSCPECYCGSQY